MNVIFGAGGFAKEVDWLIYDIFNKTGFDYRPTCFVVEKCDNFKNSLLNGIPIISESDFFKKASSIEVNCFIGIGEPSVKEKIVTIIRKNLSKYRFPNLIHPDVTFDQRVDKLILGEGSLICSKSVLTTDIKIGNFVTINLDCTVGHDSSIDNYSTLSPGARISGNVNIGERVYIGTGAVIIQNITICSDCMIGASSLVNKNITCLGTYIGMPAKKFR